MFFLITLRRDRIWTISQDRSQPMFHAARTIANSAIAPPKGRSSDCSQLPRYVDPETGAPCTRFRKLITGAK